MGWLGSHGTRPHRSRRARGVVGMGVAVGGGGVVGVGVILGRGGGFRGGRVVGVGVALWPPLSVWRRRRRLASSPCGCSAPAALVAWPSSWLCTCVPPYIIATTVSAPTATAGTPSRDAAGRVCPRTRATTAAAAATAPSAAHAVSANCGASDCSSPSIHEIPDDPRHGPRGDRPGVDEGGGPGGGPSALDEHHEPRRQLRGGDGDEQPGERGVLGVDADRRGVDRAGTERGETGQLRRGHPAGALRGRAVGREPAAVRR